jgi:hypothetical protein
MTPHEIAERLTERALDEIRDSSDAIPLLSGAIAALMIEAGEMTADDLASLEAWASGEVAVTCTCPPDLVARGGFRSSCPAHGQMEA